MRDAGVETLREITRPAKTPSVSCTPPASRDENLSSRQEDLRSARRFENAQNARRELYLQLFHLSRAG
jgi:hypothetical protein